MWRWLFIGLTVLTTTSARAQFADLQLAASLRGSYTTSSKLFYNPDSPSPIIRAEHIPLEGIYGWGVEVRIQRPIDMFFLSFSVEYLTKTLTQHQLVAFTNSPRILPVTDGMISIPIEVSVGSFIPLGSERFRMYMAGGIGAYYAERILEVAGVKAPPTNSPLAFGIHVESGFEYSVLPTVSVRAEMRFRDPEIITMNKFEQTGTVYENTTIVFPNRELKTRVNLDGLNFSVGLVAHVF
jgi:hypothetical protein